MQANYDTNLEYAAVFIANRVAFTPVQEYCDSLTVIRGALSRGVLGWPGKLGLKTFKLKGSYHSYIQCKQIQPCSSECLTR